MEHRMVPLSAMSSKSQSVPIRGARSVVAPVVGSMRSAGEIANREVSRGPHVLLPDATMPADVKETSVTTFTPALNAALPTFLAPSPSSVKTSNNAGEDDPHAGEL